MSTIRIIGVIRIVVVAIVERIDDYFDGIILPELRVGIIRVEHVILDIGSHIKMILIMGQPKGEAGVVGIGPITIPGKFKIQAFSPGMTGTPSKPPYSLELALPSMLTEPSGTIGTVKVVRSISDQGPSAVTSKFNT